MRRVHYHSMVTMTLAMVSLFFAVGQVHGQTKDGTWLAMGTDKSDYFLGEMVSLKFTVGNGSDSTLTIEPPSVERGSLRLYISDDGEKYREYIGPDWGLSEGRSKLQLELKPGDQFETGGMMLFNYKAPTFHLTESYAEEIRSERIDTDYGLSRAGRYYLKAVLDSPHTKIRIESKPIELLVSEPVREDGFAWEILRSNPASAFFLHTGELPVDEESAKQLRADLTNILERYPTCIYAERIKENLNGLSK
jgi:hypothetical protein